jgi:hypothetical protein
VQTAHLVFAIFLFEEFFAHGGIKGTNKKILIGFDEISSFLLDLFQFRLQIITRPSVRILVANSD